jgi:hypothetical protein
MSEDELNHLSILAKLQEDSSDCKSLQSNSFIMNFLSEFDRESCDLKSSSSLQLSKSSISQCNDPNTMIINKTSQLYNFVLEIPENPMKTISDLSFNESLHKHPTEAWRMSEAVTSAKNSFIEDIKEKTEKCNIHNTSFALPNRVYCNKCETDVYTIVTFQITQPSIWNSFEALLQSFRCCENKISKQYQELIHTCSKCKKILAKISTE